MRRTTHTLAESLSTLIVDHQTTVMCWPRPPVLERTCCRGGALLDVAQISDIIRDRPTLCGRSMQAMRFDRAIARRHQR